MSMLAAAHGGAVRRACRSRFLLSVPAGEAAIGFRAGAGALLGLSGANLRDSLRQRHFEPRLLARRVIEVGHGDARQTVADGALDGAQIVLFFR